MDLIQSKQIELSIKNTINRFRNDFNDLLRTKLTTKDIKSNEKEDKYHKLHYKKQKERQQLAIDIADSSLRVYYYKLIEKLQNNPIISIDTFKEQLLYCAKILYKYKQYNESEYSYVKYLDNSSDISYLYNIDSFHDKEIKKYVKK